MAGVVDQAKSLLAPLLQQSLGPAADQAVAKITAVTIVAAADAAKAEVRKVTVPAALAGLAVGFGVAWLMYRRPSRQNPRRRRR